MLPGDIRQRSDYSWGFRNTSGGDGRPCRKDKYNHSAENSDEGPRSADPDVPAANFVADVNHGSWQPCIILKTQTRPVRSQHTFCQCVEKQAGHSVQ